MLKPTREQIVLPKLRDPPQDREGRKRFEASTETEFNNNLQDQLKHKQTQQKQPERTQVSLLRSVPTSGQSSDSSTSSSVSTCASVSGSASSAKVVPAAGLETWKQQRRPYGREPSVAGGVRVLLNLAPAASNSTLVRQRASAKDSLAAASVAAGAALPLVMGGGGGGGGLQEERRAPVNSAGPQRAALRAEQRRQSNAVSVVRPVVVAGSDAGSQSTGRKIGRSLVDELMGFERQLAPTLGAQLSPQAALSVRHHEDPSDELDSKHCQMKLAAELAELGAPGELQARQQQALFRREQHELNYSIRRQHQFVTSKLEQRKRNLQIVESVWVHRDFKHAIEKLIDLYNQGLVFASLDYPHSAAATCGRPEVGPGRGCKLNSLNSSLVVDVIGVIILRPKLWNLEICSMLLPIVVNDLLAQEALLADRQRVYYAEIALKCLKLILANFSSVIKETLIAHGGSGGAKLAVSASPLAPAPLASIGVDLSQEERLSKCLICYRLLMEARGLIWGSTKRAALCAGDLKLSALCRDLEQSFACLLEL